MLLPATTRENGFRTLYNQRRIEMRYFDELSNAEREELTDEVVERYVALECARKGAPLSPGAPPVMPAPVIIEPDATIFDVGNFSFFKRDAADEVAGLIAKHLVVNLEYANNYSDRIIGIEVENPPAVSPRRVYTRIYYEQMKGQIAQRETAKKLYETAKKEHEEATKARDEASSWIWEAIEVARTRKRRRQEMREKFTQYLDLADGDRSIAWKFLVQAHSDIEKEFPELFDEFIPPMVATAGD